MNAGAQRRLGLVRDYIFGVDIDQPAVQALRLELLARINGTGEVAAQAAAVVEANIRWGDSLSGPDYTRHRAFALNSCGRPRRQKGEKGKGRSAFVRHVNSFEASDHHGVSSPPLTEETISLAAPAIDWQRDFPEAAASGGFDVIVGNPPYLRERSAKALFDALAATELGRQWREARMDLWHYFVHRSLDLLRPGGILSFIVNSYWVSSRGAERLIDRLRRETRFEEFVLFDDAPLFKPIGGRHMIFRLRKVGGGPAISPAKPVPAEREIATISRVRVSSLDSSGTPPCEVFSLQHDELFEGGRLVIAAPDPRQAVFQGRLELGAFHETRQGMAENPPAINGRLAREFAGHYFNGEGVFVLSTSEVASLQLCAAEQALLRPYYQIKDVERYRLAERPTHQVIYLTKRTAPNLDGLPRIAAHLDRFRPILERRRETREGHSAWWHLHWPREEEIFLRPRILSVQMGARPQFVFAERPTFVGFSVNLILPGGPQAFALDAVSGILNSDLAATWFERHAKRRGIRLEINAHLLRQFPLPRRDSRIEAQIAELVRRRNRAVAETPPAQKLEAEIERLVGLLYHAGDQASACDV